jgi:hypothetical protein
MVHTLGARERAHVVDEVGGSRPMGVRIERTLKIERCPEAD